MMTATPRLDAQVPLGTEPTSRLKTNKLPAKRVKKKRHRP